MRIALVSTLSAPVGRETGGSVESFVWLLTRELTRLGHEVTVFGCAGSECDGRLVATLAGPENAYFREHIRPLVDGRLVEYAGFVTGAARNRLLRRAWALLFAIQHA